MLCSKRLFDTTDLASQQCDPMLEQCQSLLSRLPEAVHHHHKLRRVRRSYLRGVVQAITIVHHPFHSLVPDIRIRCIVNAEIDRVSSKQAASQTVLVALLILLTHGGGQKRVKLAVYDTFTDDVAPCRLQFDLGLVETRLCVSVDEAEAEVYAEGLEEQVRQAGDKHEKMRASARSSAANVADLLRH